MDKKSQTIHTYNTSARAMVNKYNSIPARTEDIEELFAHISKPNPFILEIGCGTGRDAQEISKRTQHYLGLDVAAPFIDIARAAVPGAQFVVADVEEYTFPENIDAVFASASLIHTPKEKLSTLFKRIHQALLPGGLFRLSMKFATEYRETTIESEFGIRTYYLYSQKQLEDMASLFTILRSELEEAQNQTWVEMLLQKK